MKKFDFHPLAREEYFDSLDYYANRSYHAGEEFLEEFEVGKVTETSFSLTLDPFYIIPGFES